jgi:large subunit ribosomal protein L4
MKIDIYNISGEKTNRSIELSDEVFSIKPNDHAIYLDVKRILANKRQGTNASKTRSDISGSTRKLFRQKGTGGARRGDIKSPLMRGGGTVFGPEPRDYTIKINKKVKQLARKSALTYKMIENKIVIVEDFKLEQPKTKEYLQILKNLKLENKKNLFVTSQEDNSNAFLSARNIPKAFICTPEKLNTYDILNNDTVVLTESSIEIISKILN